jgi:hypothetical protein
LGTPIKTDSSGFESITVDANELQKLLADALRRKNLLHIDAFVRFIEPRQTWGWPNGISFMWSSSGTVEDKATRGTPNFRWAPLFNQVHGTVKLDARKDHVRLTLASDRAEVKMRDTKIANASMKFDGDLKPGQALLFLGRIPPEEGFEPTVIMAWQVVAVPREQAEYVTSVGGVSEWISRGLESIQRDAVEAVAWSHAAHSPDDPQPRWTKKLSSGATVKLAAVTAPPAKPWEWWDGDGVAVKMHTSVVGGGGTEGAVDIADPKYHGEGEGSANAASYEFHPGFVRVTVPVEHIETFRLRCGVGPWSNIGNLKKAMCLDPAERSTG